MRARTRKYLSFADGLTDGAPVSDTFQDVTLKGNQGFGGYKLVLPQIQPKFQIFEIWYVPRQYQKFTVVRVTVQKNNARTELLGSESNHINRMKHPTT